MGDVARSLQRCDEVVTRGPYRAPMICGILALPGAPPPGEMLGALGREGVELVEAPWSALLDGMVAPPLLFVWAPAGVSRVTLATLCAWRRERQPATALLGAACEGNASDTEDALDAGFDDFVCGRVSPRELAARLRVLTRRLAAAAEVTNDRLRSGAMVIDRARHELRVDDRAVALTALELELLWTLAVAGGRTLSREELLDAAWGSDHLEVGPRAVDNLIQRLRRKIGAHEVIHTVRGVGFRIARG
jgi:DNA-binding response OmpR family regulator